MGPQWSLIGPSSCTSLAAAAGDGLSGAVPSCPPPTPRRSLVRPAGPRCAPGVGLAGARGCGRESALRSRCSRRRRYSGTSRPDMALNKSMHARNRYKDKPPDFAYLAGKYPEFQQHVQTTLAGRVRYGRGGMGRVGARVCPPAGTLESSACAFQPQFQGSRGREGSDVHPPEGGFRADYRHPRGKAHSHRPFEAELHPLGGGSHRPPGCWEANPETRHWHRYLAKLNV